MMISIIAIKIKKKKTTVLKPVEGITDLINAHTVSPEKQIFFFVM